MSSHPAHLEPLALAFEGADLGRGIEVGDELVVDSQQERSLRFASGREAIVKPGPGEESLVIRGPEGGVELSVRFTADGPVLRFESAAFDLRSVREISLSCETFRVNAQKSVEIRAGEDMLQEVGGNIEMHSGGETSLEGHSLTLRSRRGDVTLWANDDVRLEGERIKLNC